MCVATLPTCTFINAATGREYSGANVQKLQDCVDSNPRFITGAFATFRQWLTVGRVVRKGEKAAAQLLAFTDEGKPAEATDKPSADGKRCRFARTFLVFALEQTEKLEDKPAESAPVVDDKPEPGKVYNLSMVASEGSWKAAQVPSVKQPMLAMDKIISKAEGLLAQAEACFADRLQNTPKRLAQAMHKRMEGQRMERAAHILKAYMHAVDAGQDPLPGVTASQLITWAQEAAIYTAKPVSNGYHGYHVETTDAKHTEAHHITLRGLLDPRATAESAARIAKEQAEAELRNADFPGFFPTPKPVIREMLNYAGDLFGANVLEPSAGKGDIVQAALDAGAKSVRSFEIVPKLADYLHRFVTVKGSTQAHVTQNADFMEVTPAPVKVDAVLMNPPFERNQAPQHVAQALRWLKDGGRLVSVMPAGWIEKDSATPLLVQIEAEGRSYIEVDIEGAAFNGADAFRQTGVRVSLLVIS